MTPLLPSKEKKTLRHENNPLNKENMLSRKTKVGKKQFKETNKLFKHVP